jgi:hypothetical protein
MPGTNKTAVWMFLSAAIGAVVGGVVVRPTPPAEAGDNGLSVIKAQRFLVVDKSGRERAALGASDGGVSFQLVDSTGAVRLNIAIDDAKETASLSVLSKGKPRLVLGELESGTELTYYDPDGIMRLQLASTKGEPDLTLFNVLGNAYWSTPSQ